MSWVGIKIMMNNRKTGSDKVTISDVAKKAGVSPGTVSRALNTNGYISETTRKQVMEAINALGYVPNRAGRILKTAKTELIMLAIPDTSNEIYFGMIEAVHSFAKTHGYSLVLFYTDGQHTEEMRAVRMLQERVIDGLILIHFSFKEELYHTIKQAGQPTVLCGMCNSLWSDPKYGLDTISIDVYQAIYDATSHLISQGHRDIAYLAGKKGIEVYRQRYNAYRQALVDHGIPYRDEWVFFNGYTDESGYRAGKTLLSMEDRPTAVCASNDLQAIGFWRAAKDAGVRVGEDIALIGLDNLRISQMLDISSINMYENTVGRVAAEMLFARMDDDKEAVQMFPHSISIKPELVLRASTSAVIG